MPLDGGQSERDLSRQVGLDRDHLRNDDARLAALLDRGEVLGHPFIAGEIALGSLRHRGLILTALCELAQAIVASADEVLRFIDDQKLFGLGIGYVVPISSPQCA